MTLFLAVTADKYELPLFVAETRREMAEWHGVSIDAIASAMYRYERDANRRKQHNPASAIRFCRVEVDDEE